MINLLRKQKRKDQVGTAKNKTSIIQRKPITVKAEFNLPFPHKDMFKNVF
jgi:hypothetical protein